MQGDAWNQGLYTSSHGTKGTVQGKFQYFISHVFILSQENLFMNMSLADFEAAIGPKVHGSWNLHSLLPKGMDFFVMLSSLAGIVGLAGMTNYACGNTYQDALVQHRIAHNEKAVSLDLCNIDNVGYVAEREGLMESLDGQGLSVLTETEFLALLDYYCNPGLPLTSPMQSQVIIGLQARHAPQTKRNRALDRPLFSILRQTAADQGGATTTAEPDSTVDLTALIRAADTLDKAADVVADGIVSKLSRLLATEKENVDSRRPIATYGVDSLSAVEMRIWFRNVLGAEVTTFDILGNESIAVLSSSVAAKSRFVKASVKEN